MKTNKYLNLLLLIFFASGFSGLVYEIVWIRMLVFIFGNTAQSIAIVVSAFMAGLAFGSFFLGKIADRTNKLLALYAYLELGIAVLGILSPIFIQLARNVFASYSSLVVENSTFSLTLKATLSFLIIFPPTLLMGGTLPVLIRYFNNFYGNLSKQTGKLYGLNTLGAVFGVLSTGFIFIELFGLLGSLIIAVAISLSLGSITLYLAKTISLSTVKSATQQHSQSELKPVLIYSKPQIVFLLVTYSLSGFISLSYEILWTRLITPAAGIYIYGFSLMLAFFLLGLALGSLLYERYLSKFIHVFFLVGILQVLLALTAFLVIVFVSFAMPIWTRYLYRLTVSAIVFLPATTIMGMMFPAVSKVFEKTKKVGEKIGMIYAFNSFGSILGSVVAGFIMIPLLGTVESVLILAIVNSLLGLFLIIQEVYKKYKVQAVTASLLLMGLLISGLYNSQGLLLPRLYKIHIRDAKQKNPNATFVFKEDSVASVFAIHSQNPKQPKVLLIDGVPTTALVEETKMMAHLPILLHPNPKDILVIAFGMGTTFRSALTYPNTYLDAVELVPSVPKLMSSFHSDAQMVLTNPRGKVIINDGRNYVFITSKKYDVVTIDPPPPTNGAGTTVLFSDEFYRDIKKKLNNGGIIQAWIHFDLDIDRIRMMAKSFTNNFPHILVYLAPSGKGMYLLGSSKPMHLDQERLNQMLQIKSVAEDMAEWSGKPYSYDRLRAMYIGNQEQLTFFTQNTPPVTDYMPRIEYSLIRTMLNPQPILTKQQLLENF